MAAGSDEGFFDLRLIHTQLRHALRELGLFFERDRKRSHSQRLVVRAISSKVSRDRLQTASGLWAVRVYLPHAFMAKESILENSSPAALGFSMPAEWEEHEATWLGWPHNATDWPGKLDTIRWVYGEMVRKIAAGERARILISGKTHEKLARNYLSRAGADLRRLD